MNRQGLADFNQQLKEKALDGFIVTNPTNIFYLTGFRGVMPQERESILVFNPKPTLITARLYQNEAKKLASADLKVKIVTERNRLFENAANIIYKTHLRGVRAHPEGEEDGLQIGFEENDLKYGEYVILTSSRARGKNLNRSFVESDSTQDDKGGKPGLTPYRNLIEKMRLTKTADEIKKIAKAQIISQKAFDIIIKTVKVGQTEEEIADRLEKIIKLLGGQRLAFESIIASGPNSGIPHYTTGRRKIKKGDTLLFDFGAKYQNYCADLSRTVFVGKAQAQARNIFNHVLTAQQKAIERITSGIKSSEAYYAVHDHFKKHGLHRNFLHGLGHGIGLEAHEAPYLRPNLPSGPEALGRRQTTTYQLLTNNMVFSVEPGLYFPWGGVRIEDLVTIATGGTYVLGQLPKDLHEIY